MKLPELAFEQKIRRVSQMRRLGLSLHEAHDNHYKLAAWLERFEDLRSLPRDRFPTKVSEDDLAALRAGFKENWVKKNYDVIIEMVKIIHPEVLHRDPVLAAFAGAAKEQLEATMNQAATQD
jgi:hypothetical protein